MERTNALLWALFAGVEPILIGLVADWQRLVLVGLCNIFIIMIVAGAEKKQSHIATHPFSYQKHLQHLRTQNNYYGAICFISIVIGIVAYILEPGDHYAKIALALMTTGIAYRVFAAATHGLKNTWTQGLSKICGLLIVVGVGWAYLGSNGGQAFFTSLPQTISKLRTVPTAIAPSAGEPTKLIPQTNISQSTTGETNTVINDITNNTTGSSQIPEKNDAIQNNDSTADTRDNTTPLTFAQVVPAIVKSFNLPVPQGSITFANIPSTSPVYNDFKAGYAARFFGQGINPNATVSCNVYLVMIGLAQKRDVQYTATTVFDAYRKAAASRNQTYDCAAGTNVTARNLPL